MQRLGTHRLIRVLLKYERNISRRSLPPFVKARNEFCHSQYWLFLFHCLSSLVFCKLLVTYSLTLRRAFFPDVHDSARLSDNYSSHSVHSAILGIQVKLCIGNCSSLCR